MPPNLAEPRNNAIHAPVTMVSDPDWRRMMVPLGAVTVLIENGRAAPQAIAGVADGMSLASLRRF
jgi:hypothetical protein